MLAKRIGVDAGTSSCLVEVRGEGLVVDEPSVVAWDRRRSRIVAVGREALRMGARSGKLDLVRPFRQGAIADLEVAQALLVHLIGKVDGRHRLFRPEVVVAVPPPCSGALRCVLSDAAMSAGARQVWLIEKPLAAALGAELSIAGREASVICVLGGGATHMAAFAGGGTVAARSIPVGGADLDAAIAAHFGSRHGVDVSADQAEELKIAAGAAPPGVEGLVATLRAREMSTGSPKSVEMASREIAATVEEPLGKIAEELRGLIEDARREVGSGLAPRTVLLAGGGALLRGLDGYIASRVGIPAAAATSPRTCVVRGALLAVERLEVLKRHQVYLR